jgi:hypothetical protein
MTPLNTQASQSPTDSRPTAAEILSWPPTIDPRAAGRALGISQTHAYTLCRENRFPVKVVRAGQRYCVITSDLWRVLGLTADSSSVA